VQPGVLGAKTKELMALAISIVQRCDGCISFHVQAAVEAGATRQELAETLGVAIMMGGDPATVYAAQALNAIDAFLPAPVNPQPALIVDDENVEDPFAVNAD
jgi:AhpD family alkylhydroperoxidase